MARKSSKDIRIEELEKERDEAVKRCWDVMAERDSLENELSSIKETVENERGLLFDTEKKNLDLQAENSNLRETIALLKSQLLIYEKTLNEEKKHNPRGAGRKKGDKKFIAGYDAFCAAYEANKSMAEIMKECGISRATYFRHKRLYEDTKINI